MPSFLYGGTERGEGGGEGEGGRWRGGVCTTAVLTS